MKISIKSLVSGALLTSAILLLVSCGGAQKKEVKETVKEKPVVKSEIPDTPKVSSGMVLSGLNSQLDKVPVMGFRAFKKKFSKEQMDYLGNKLFPIIKELINQVPAGHVIMATGHANHYPGKSKSYTKALSKKRAKSVYSFLVKKGISSKKLKYSGAGSSQPIDSSEPRTPDNRRVTFKVVPK